MTTRIWSKPVTQCFIKRLREAGYTVDRVPNGYVCHHQFTPDCLDLVFKAMIGSRGYLVHVNDRYVKSENELA
jgi:hypothetical protein